MSQSVIIDLVCREVFNEEEIESGMRHCGRARDAVKREQNLDEIDEVKRLHKKRRKGRKLCTDGNGVDAFTQGSELVNYEVEDPIHTKLPVEMRRKIFHYLRGPELLGLRTISKNWTATIDSILAVDVSFDGGSSTFKGPCSLAMKTCTLMAFQNPCHRRLFQSNTPLNVKIVRGMCSMNFCELLWNWSSITKLELCWRTTMKNILFEKKSFDKLSISNVIFPMLTHLNVEILQNDNLGDRTQSRITANVNSLTSFDYPSLQHLSLTFVGYRELHVHNHHLPTLLAFINRHADSLVSIEVSLKYISHVVYPPVHPRHILFCVPANLRKNHSPSQSTHDGVLVTSELRRAGSSAKDCSEWKEMLKSQRKLETALTTRFLNWTIRHLSYFTSTINAYSKFLRRIELMNLTMYDGGNLETVTQLDARIFRDCSQLAELSLYRAPIIFHEEEVEPPNELINIQFLPKSLEKLIIDGLPVTSVELLAFVGTFSKLKSFQYFQSPVPHRNNLRTNGVDWDVLTSLVTHKTLSQIKVHVSHFGQLVTFPENLETPLTELASTYGWQFKGMFPGYMNLFQITLSKADRQ